MPPAAMSRGERRRNSRLGLELYHWRSHLVALGSLACLMLMCKRMLAPGWGSWTDSSRMTDPRVCRPGAATALQR